MKHVEIRIKGQLEKQWTAWFDELNITSTQGNETILTGPLHDQAALYGILNRLRNLGLPLISVKWLYLDAPEQQKSEQDLT